MMSVLLLDNHIEVDVETRTIVGIDVAVAVGLLVDVWFRCRS